MPVARQMVLGDDPSARFRARLPGETFVPCAMYLFILRPVWGGKLGGGFKGVAWLGCGWSRLCLRVGRVGREERSL